MRKNNIKFEEVAFKGYMEFKDINAENGQSDSGYKLDVYIRKLQKNNGDVTIGIYVKQKFDKDEFCSCPMEVRADRMISDLRKLKAKGLKLNSIDINKIENLIKDNWVDLPIKQVPMNLGFNTKGKKIEHFVGACTVSADGKYYKNEDSDRLPELRGTLDVELLKRVLSNKKRRLVVLHGLLAPLVGLEVIFEGNQYCPIVIIIGESRTGKTTLARFVESLCVHLGYKVTILNFNSTDISRLERVKGNKGIVVLMDDTSLTSAKNLEKIVYSLADRDSRDRCNSNREGISLEENETHGTSFIMTSEYNPLLNVNPDNLGVNARAFPLIVEGSSDLFEDVQLINEMEHSMEKNTGVLLPMIAKWMFDHKLNEADTFRNMVDTEKKNLEKLISEKDGIILSWLSYFAYMRIVASALKDITGIDVETDEVIQYMASTIKNNVCDQKEETTSSLVVNELHPSLITLEELKDDKSKDMCRKDGNLYIRSRRLKKEINTFISENNIPKTHLGIIGEMKARKLLKQPEAGKWYKHVSGYGQCYCLAELGD